MNLRSFDLNLLKVFDVIFAERSISKAAHKLSLSQPAVSNALNRLRTRLGDQLFVPTPRGMMPTARAKQLAEPIRQALDLLEQGFEVRDDFDFERAKRTFVVGLEAYGESVILPRFIDWLTQVAPNIQVKIRPEPIGMLVDDLKSGLIDLALDYSVPTDPGFQNECVLTDNLVSMSRREHPLLADRLTLKLFLSLRHVALRPRASGMPILDTALSKRGLQRNIAVEVPNFLSMPVLVQSTNLLCTLPKRMAILYSDHFRIRIHAVPLSLPPFPIHAVWHRSLEPDRSHQWFRQSLMEFCQRI